MGTATIILKNRSSDGTSQMGEWESEPKVYRCDIAFLREDNGTFSAIILNLPGAGSCGDSIEDALANVREAAAGVIASYLDRNLPIPWATDYSTPPNAIRKWILVNV